MKRLIGFFVVALLLSNFVVSAQTAAPEHSISVKELKTQIKEDSALVILDVRNPEELKGPLGKIDGSINIPVQDLEKRIGELDKYKDKEIAVICRTGHRSGIATKLLLKNGFTKVENVKGGMTAYREK